MLSGWHPVATCPLGDERWLKRSTFSQGRIEQPGTPAVPPPPGVGRQLCLLWFLDRDPNVCFPDAFTSHVEALRESGKGELRFCGPFVPTVVGTDRYVDELR